MAQIQIWTRDVKDTDPLGRRAPQHTFLVKVNDDGTREIIRGGPENDNMVIDDLKIAQKELKKLRSDIKITPGMPAQVFVVTGSRVMLDYLFSPIRDSAYKAFREE